MLEIWGRRNSGNAIPVMFAVGELGLNYKRHDVGGSFGGLDTAAYAQLNPNRKIPTVNDNGRVIWESQTIIRYLAREYGSGTLWPEDSYELAMADQWMEWAKTTIVPHLTAVFFGLVRFPPEKRDPDAIAAGAVAFGRELQIVERQLENTSFLAGDQLTVGDIPLGAYVYRYFNLDIERPSLPNVEAWYARLRDRPAYQKHVMIPFGRNPHEWLELEKAGANA